MTITQVRLSEQDYLHLPDDGRKYELVDGEPKEVPAGHEHDTIGITVATLIRPFARGRGFVAGSQAGFLMANGNIRSPDVSFMRADRLPGGKPGKGFAQGAPDLCVEILSPSEERSEIERKLREYFASGAQKVWHLMPETQRVHVFESPADYTEYGPTDTLTEEALLPGFTCVVAELFALE